jgi:7-carboxy-7-deazaguanine synthase
VLNAARLNRVAQGKIGVRIAEIFRSRQGEGEYAGTDSLFVRFSGCNLRCWFCDTPYTSWRPEGETIRFENLVREVAECPAEHVVVTGGEPMLVPELGELTRRIGELGKHLTIETAGTVFQQVACDLMSISPKLANSTPPLEQAGAWRARHESARHQPDVLRRLIQAHAYQLKFVVDKPEDLADIEAYLADFPEVPPERVWLMPQGVELAALRRREEWLRPQCAARGYRLCSRKHIEWYGNRRGT